MFRETDKRDAFIRDTLRIFIMVIIDFHGARKKERLDDDGQFFISVKRRTV